MTLVAKSAKGLNRLLLDEALPPERLTLHISEVGPGARAHPPHTHEGIEGFYIIEGRGVVEVGEERHALAAGEAALIDATSLHGLVNAGAGPLRYMVIIARPS